MIAKKFKLFIFVSFFILISLIIFNVNASAKRLNYKTGMFFYYSTSEYSLTDDEYMSYIKSYHYDTYSEYHEDEFSWQDKVQELKDKLDKKISSFNKDEVINSTYVTYGGKDFGKYNFELGGFPLNVLYKTSYIPYEARSVGSMADVKVFFTNPNQYNFLKLDKKEGKKLIEKRKNKYGNIDREIIFKVYFNLLPVDSKEHKKCLSGLNYNPKDRYILTAKINKIEIYNNKNLEKKLGELIKEDL